MFDSSVEKDKLTGWKSSKPPVGVRFTWWHTASAIGMTRFQCTQHNWHLLPGEKPIDSFMYNCVVKSFVWWNCLSTAIKKTWQKQETSKQTNDKQTRVLSVRRTGLGEQVSLRQSLWSSWSPAACLALLGCNRSRAVVCGSSKVSN